MLEIRHKGELDGEQTVGKDQKSARPTDQREESKGDRKMRGIEEMLRKIQFRKKWFGGVDEA